MREERRRSRSRNKLRRKSINGGAANVARRRGDFESMIRSIAIRFPPFFRNMRLHGRHAKAGHGLSEMRLRKGLNKAPLKDLALRAPGRYLGTALRTRVPAGALLEPRLRFSQ